MKNISKISVFFLISLMAHFVLLTIALYYTNQEKRDFATGDDSIKVTFVPVTEELLKHRQQIINFERQTEEKPDEARFLGKHDFKVEKETVARPSQIVAFLAPEYVASQMPERTTRPQQSPEGDTVRRDITAIFPEEVFSEIAREDETRRRNLKPQAMGGMVDHIERVDVGDQTLLNTNEFKYYGYFSRMREQVRQYWMNNVREAAYKSYVVGRSLASDMKHETKVVLTLDEFGAIEEITIIKSSGVDVLDKASIDAFMDSGPFPNPPKDLVESEKKIKITWSFLVNVS